jgi:hypothetical protein
MSSQVAPHNTTTHPVTYINFANVKNENTQKRSPKYNFKTMLQEKN